MRIRMTFAVGATSCALMLLASKNTSASLDWSQPGDGETSVFEGAMRKGDLTQVQAWLDEGLKVDTLLRTIRGGLPLLDFAIMSGRLDAVKLLLAAGAEPEQMAKDKQSNESYSPLMFAAANGSTEIAAELIERGADVDKPGARGVTALMVAAVHEKPAVVRLLLEKGAEVNAVIDDSMDSKALNIDRMNITFMPKDVPPVPGFFYEPAGATALWLATLADHQEVVALLLEAKADRSAEASCAQLPQVPAEEKACNAARLAELLDYKEISKMLGASEVETAATVRVRAKRPTNGRISFSS